MKRFVMLIALLALGPGCVGGGALSTVGGVLAGLASGAGVDYAEDKFAAKVEWGSKQAEMIAVKRSGIMAMAGMHLMAGNYGCWLQTLDDALKFHDSVKPLFLIEKAIQKRTAPASGPAPQRLDCSPPARPAVPSPPDAGGS